MRNFKNLIYSYLNAAKDYIKVLQEYEQASKYVQEESDGKESDEFIKLWFEDVSNRPELSSINKDWNTWYKEVSIF